MVVLHPDGLQFGKPILLEVGHGFYVFAVEVVLHDVVEDLALALPVTTQELQQHHVESLILDLRQLQVVLALLQQPQLVLHV